MSFLYTLILQKEIGKQHGKMLISLYMAVRHEFLLCSFSELCYMFNSFEN